MHPLIILAIGILIVLGMIIVLRIHAFLALITAAIVVSLLAPGDFAVKIGRVAAAFGTTTGKIGIVIALAAVIGRCLIESGAADRIVRVFVRLLGEKRCPVSLMTSGFVLSVPVFFDTVFYLLLPLARSMHRRTKRSYLLLILAMGAGASITHSLVPPTPGPLIIADTLGIDLGVMINIGLLVALPTAIVMLFFIGFLTRRMEIPMRPLEGGRPEPEPLPDEKLPGLWLSLLPIILPVIMISSHTIATTMANSEHVGWLRTVDIQWSGFTSSLTEDGGEPDSVGGQVMVALPEDVQQSIRQGAMEAEVRANVQSAINKLLGEKELYSTDVIAGVALSERGMKLLDKGVGKLSKAELESFNRLVLEAAYPEHIKAHIWETSRRKAANITAVTGNANLAMLAATAFALYVLWRQRKPSRAELSKIVETSLMSGGVIILITSGGGAFGAMLKAAEIDIAIKGIFAGGGGGELGGVSVLLLGFFIAFLLKFAQGSSTVSMITTSSMMVGFVASPEALGFHPVYLATSIGFGSQCGNWMNDSGFWIFAKMSGLTEVETLKTWTVTVSTLAFVGLGFSLLFAKVLPLI